PAYISPEHSIVSSPRPAVSGTCPDSAPSNRPPGRFPGGASLRCFVVHSLHQPGEVHRGLLPARRFRYMPGNGSVESTSRSIAGGASLRRVLVSKRWCERRDSNSHGSPHWNLNPARLPVPPLSPAFPAVAGNRPGHARRARRVTRWKPGVHEVVGREGLEPSNYRLSDLCT